MCDFSPPPTIRFFPPWQSVYSFAVIVSILLLAAGATLIGIHGYRVRGRPSGYKWLWRVWLVFYAGLLASIVWSLGILVLVCAPSLSAEESWWQREDQRLVGAGCSNSSLAVADNEFWASLHLWFGIACGCLALAAVLLGVLGLFALILRRRLRTSTRMARHA